MKEEDKHSLWPNKNAEENLKCKSHFFYIRACGCESNPPTKSKQYWKSSSYDKILLDVFRCSFTFLIIFKVGSTSMKQLNHDDCKHDPIECIDDTEW